MYKSRTQLIYKPEIVWLTGTRYENKRSIIRLHLHDLFAIKSIKSGFGIRQLLDDVDADLRGLKVCGENTDAWSTIISYYVSYKLDETPKKNGKIRSITLPVFPASLS